MIRFAALSLSIAFALAIGPPAAADGSNKLGTVNFPVSCNAAAQARFNTATTMLHSFWYDRSEEAFLEVANDDPTCAMAYWGIAMSRWHELWEWPDAQDVRVAKAAVARAEQIGGKTDKERRFIAAIAAFYRGYNPSTGYGGDDRYAADMKALYSSYPSDRQVALFYALALIATAPPDDMTFSQRLKAGAILEPIFKAEPNDPGAAHYIIHAYDDPKLAPRALYAAREYSKIAPAVPHALHMPSHTFTDLGLWEDSIASNLASLSAEHQDYPNTEHLGTANFDDFHGTDFLEYAYLQSGRIVDAADLAQLARASRTVPDTPGDQTEFVLTLSRGLIDRQEWRTARAFMPPTAPGAKVTQPVALAAVDYVRGLGAARSGDMVAANAALRDLGNIEKSAKAGHFAFVATYAKVQEDALAGWIAQAGGHRDTAIASLRRAAANAESFDRSPPPFSVWPMKEQIAELLLEDGRPADALNAFRDSLTDYPNRLQSLSGAAKAASDLGEKALALSYYQAILRSCPHADPNVPEIVQAQAAVRSASH